MPTIGGLRRRGYTPEAIRAFCRAIGVAKANSVVDARMLEHFLREDLKLKAPRAMAVLRPLKVVLVNWPEDRVETLEAEVNAENPDMGTRTITISRELYIERDDFTETPPKGYYRLYPGNEVRLKHAYIVRCEEVVRDENGEIAEIRCSFDPESKSGSGAARKVKGTIHWVDARSAVPVEFRLYEPLILDETAASAGVTANGSAGTDEDEEDAFLARVNPRSLEVLHGFVDPDVAAAKPYDRFQFIRQGYFAVDPKLSQPGRPVFNRIVALKSSYDPSKA